MKYILITIMALVLVGCNDTKIVEVESNDTIKVRQTFIALCDEVTTISIMANDGNVTIDDNNSYAGSNLDVSINVVVDCLETTVCEECNTTCVIIDDNETIEDDNNGTD